MEGDKVFICTTVTERDGASLFDTEIGEKPQFMLDEEYIQHIVNCAIESVKSACKVCFPNPVMQRKIADMIAKKASEGF